MSQEADGYIGMFGHTFYGRDDGQDANKLKYQFQIIKKVGSSSYACQLFSWLDGDATSAIVLSEAQLVNDCRLYLDRERWCYDGGKSLPRPAKP